MAQAYDLCPDDPAACHELGVLMYKCGQHAAGAMWLSKALQLLPGGRPTPCESGEKGGGGVLQGQTGCGVAVHTGTGT